MNPLLILGLQTLLNLGDVSSQQRASQADLFRSSQAPGMARDLLKYTRPGGARSYSEIDQMYPFLNRMTSMGYEQAPQAAPKGLGFLGF